MADPSPDLSIPTLRGGMNDTDPPHLVAEDQCVQADNVEWFYSTLGERRLGMVPYGLGASTLDSQTAIVHLVQRFPSNDITAPEVWAVGATVSTSAVIAKRSTAGVWSVVTPTDALTTTAPDIYNIQSQALHGKLFLAYLSGQNRLHVYDGTTLRRTGLTQPAAPTAANTGVGTLDTKRYYRVRYIIKSGSTLVARSEPSTALTFTPSGGGSAVRVTKPAAITESETHWELDASFDNANFYLIATTVVGTTTYDDSTMFATTTYASVGPLSDAIGSYLLIQSCRFLAADGDRLLMGSHFTDALLQSRVSWTPVYNDPGVGNDERLPLVSTGGLPENNFVDLDANEGGGLTGISQVINGSWYAFKWQAIYTMIRTGDVSRAYDAVCISKTRGGLPGSIVHGMDQYGQACIYFLDPVYGPSRVGPGGLETIRGLRTTWLRINQKATNIVSRAVYYPDHQQVWWWVAVDGANTPNMILKLQVTALRYGAMGLEGGWSRATGTIATAYCAAAINESNTNADGNTILSIRPYAGLTTPNFIQRCDVGDDDNGNTYVALLLSRIYFLAGILNKWGGMVSALLATVSATASVKIVVIRDFGEQTSTITTTLTSNDGGSEGYVVKFLDSLNMSSARGIQFEFTDP